MRNFRYILSRPLFMTLELFDAIKLSRRTFMMSRPIIVRLHLSVRECVMKYFLLGDSHIPWIYRLLDKMGFCLQIYQNWAIIHLINLQLAILSQERLSNLQNLQSTIYCAWYCALHMWLNTTRTTRLACPCPVQVMWQQCLLTCCCYRCPCGICQIFYTSKIPNYFNFTRENA